MRLIFVLFVVLYRNRYGDGTTGGGCEERLKRHHHRSWIHGGKWNFREGQSHYLDLAGIENYSSLNNRNGVEEADGCPAVHGEGQCPYHVIPDAATTHPKQSWECGHHACHTNRSRNQRHHRSRSHDLADPTCGYFRYRLLADGGETTAPQSSTRVRTEEEEEGLLSSCKFPGGGGEKGDWQNGRHHHHHHHHSHGGGGGGGVSGHHRRERDLHAALYHARSKSYDAYYCEQATTTTPASFSPKLKEHISKRGGATGSPHHHKHRHRERDHQRAMQQVASWIEKEHLGFGGCNLMSKGAAPEQASATGGHQQQQNNHHYCSQQHHIPPPPPPPPPPPHVLHNQRPSSPRTSEKASFLVERHEHHHVHEHFHHHYHHYHEL